MAVPIIRKIRNTPSVSLLAQDSPFKIAGLGRTTAAGTFDWHYGHFVGWGCKGLKQNWHCLSGDAEKKAANPVGPNTNPSLNQRHPFAPLCVPTIPAAIPQIILHLWVPALACNASINSI
jgi:hypothetical protein